MVLRACDQRPDLAEKEAVIFNGTPKDDGDDGDGHDGDDDDDDGDDDGDDDDGDGDGDIGNGSHHYLMVVWALSTGDCLKFPSFPSSLTVGRVRM